MRSTNPNAPVRCSKTISINATVEKTWAILTNINLWSNWQADISYAKLDSLLSPNTSFVWKSNGVKIHSTLHTIEQNKRFGWSGNSLGLHAIHNWILKDNNEHTEVTVEETMEGFLARLFNKSLNKSLEKGMQRWLSFLKKECESENQIEDVLK